jgi:1-acyl-sn-glycerol-3-phosphate acyltransferase
VKRPVRFVMYAGYRGNPFARWITAQAKVIPIAGAKEDPEMLQRAMDAVARELDDGQVVGIFPEGHLTKDGEIAPFRPGIERIVARNPVPVVPMALNGLWGSWFSRHGGVAIQKLPRRFWSRVSLTATAPVPAEQVTADALRERVADLWSKGAP